MSEHMGVSVEMVKVAEFDSCIRVTLGQSVKGYHAYNDAKQELQITLPSLNDAEALRDALSAFITFHRRMREPKNYTTSDVMSGAYCDPDSEPAEHVEQP